ncbi:hypothetical protein [Krasilnikovia sp. MM14-A1004]|uniref:hypothetical protein n=1 Tax=Krasilnikovia sp. MM14-A1004 TaxID=3373541 RepID=UPI00399C8258
MNRRTIAGACAAVLLAVAASLVATPAVAGTRKVTFKPAASYADAGAAITFTATAPLGSSRLRVEHKVGNRWVHNATTVGKVTSSKKSHGVLRLTGSVRPAWGSGWYRVSVRKGGKTVVSKAVKLAGYKWVPLRTVAPAPTPGQADGSVAVNGRGVPRWDGFSSLWGNTDKDISEDYAVSCRKVDVALVFSPGATAGSASWEFITGNGKVQTFAGSVANRQTRRTLSLDGSSSLTIHYTLTNLRYDMGSGEDGKIDFAALGYCHR